MSDWLTRTVVGSTLPFILAYSAVPVTSKTDGTQLVTLRSQVSLVSRGDGWGAADVLRNWAVLTLTLFNRHARQPEFTLLWNLRFLTGRIPTSGPLKDRT